jgi:archaellin
MAGHKAISTIVAVLLVTAITLAVALSAFTFIQKTQRSAQGITETSTSTFLQRASTCGKLVSFKFNPVTNISEAIIKNCGFRDIDLSNDNLQIMVKTQAESCVFKLNSTNCANCIGKLGIGSFTALQINASAVYCASTLADLLNAAIGQNVQVVMSDTYASFNTATTFVPAPVVVCDFGLNRPSAIVNVTACYNYTITNLGNAPDKFTINVPQYFFPGSPMLNLFNSSNCSGSYQDTITTATLPVNGTWNFSVFVNLEGAPPPFCPNVSCSALCFASVKSNNCAGTSARDIINQTC